MESALFDSGPTLSTARENGEPTKENEAPSIETDVMVNKTNVLRMKGFFSTLERRWGTERPEGAKYKQNFWRPEARAFGNDGTFGAPKLAASPMTELLAPRN